jgi:ABC transport system ATP-binding/permease protein
VATLQKREGTLHDLLAAHATDYAKVAELDAELRAVVAEREAAEEQWLLLADSLG